MKIFLDTSSLIKLYHEEIGTEYLDTIFEEYKVTKIFLSELAKIEFDSAIMKKVRTKELTEEESSYLIHSFEADYNKYTFINLDRILLKNAKILISKHGLNGLRTLDSLQLASIIEVKTELDFVITADDTLKSIIRLEGINTK